MLRISRRAVAAIIAVSALLPGGASAADTLKEIHIDWATYNPVSMVLKQKGLLEKEFAKDGIGIVWVQSAGSNKALEFLNAGSIDFGSTAGSAALVARINGNGDRQGFQDRYRRRPQGQAGRGHPRNRSAHLPGARAARCRPVREGHHAGAAAARRRQDRADPRRRR